MQILTTHEIHQVSGGGVIASLFLGTVGFWSGGALGFFFGAGVGAIPGCIIGGLLGLYMGMDGTPQVIIINQHGERIA